MKLPDDCNTSQETLDKMNQMLCSLHVTICLLMSPRNVDGVVVDQHVKIFLSCCHHFAIGYYGRNSGEFWVNKGNFVSMLNLGEQIENFGPICWYWEGTHGRFIQTVKVVLVSLRKSTSYLEKKCC